MHDRTSKAIFAAIALGLWMNAAAVFLRPLPANAQDTTQKLIVVKLMDIENDVQDIAQGTCRNEKICGSI